jgi:23S rRNA (uracil1939-C5)-methyltransferase
LRQGAKRRRAAPTVRVAIERIAAGGDGLGRLPDGRVVFVPRTAPGDRARVEILREHARYCRGRLVSLEEPGPDRTPPRCAHYERDACGGCQLQHLSEAAQQRARRAMLGEALRRIGRLEREDPPLEPAASAWAYRAKISLSRGPGDRYGFHRLGAPGRIFELVRCEIAAAPLAALWSRLRPLRSQLPRSARELVLRTDRTGGVHLVVETADPAPWSGAEALRCALEADAGLPSLGLWQRPAGGEARAVAGRDSGHSVAAFEQVNPEMGDRARRFAVAGLGEVSGRAAWDLYAGIGETSRLLALAGARVESVERDPAATGAAESRLRAEGLPVRVHTGRVEDLADALGPPDLAVANPPRRGMERSALASLCRRPPRRLSYVSCDPATLARDLGVLVREGPFRLAELRGFDLFPQTAHVESVAVLERR